MMVIVDAELTDAVRRRHREVSAAIAAADDEMLAIRGARADGTADDEHDPEGSTLSDDWSRVAGMRGDLHRTLSELDDALIRLEHGYYGLCDRCGAEIPRERLIARPAARECVTCASRS